MEKSVSCMVLPVGDVSFLLPCTAVVEIFKASRGSGFDYEDPKNGISIGRVEWRYAVVPAVDLSGLTNCENRVNTDDQVFFAVVNTAIKNKSGALMYLAVALDDMPSLVKINGNQGVGGDEVPSLYAAHGCTEAFVDEYGKVFVPDMKEVVRVFLGLSAVKIRTDDIAKPDQPAHAHRDSRDVFASGTDEEVFTLVSSMMSEAESEDSSVASAARSILRAVSAILVSAREQLGVAITTDAISKAAEMPVMLQALTGTATINGADVALTIDVVGMVSDALKSIDGFDAEKGADQDAAVIDGYGYAQMSIAYIVEGLENK